MTDGTILRRKRLPSKKGNARIWINGGEGEEVSVSLISNRKGANGLGILAGGGCRILSGLKRNKSGGNRDSGKAY